jgi:hypothetical protein
MTNHVTKLFLGYETGAANRLFCRQVIIIETLRAVVAGSRINVGV